MNNLLTVMFLLHRIITIIILRKDAVIMFPSCDFDVLLMERQLIREQIVIGSANLLYEL